jgi:hypothetical protein
MVPDGPGTHHSKVLTRRSLPHTMSYQAYHHLNSVGIPSLTSGRPPPTFPQMSYHEEQAYPALNDVGTPAMRSGPPPPTQLIVTESQSIDQDDTSSH